MPSIRIVDGVLRKGDVIQMMNNDAVFEVIEVGVQHTQRRKKSILAAGDVGYLSAAIKDIDKVRVGDTITLKNNRAQTSLPGL